MLLDSTFRLCPYLTRLPSVFLFRSVLHPRSGLVWLFCQQSQDPSLQRHHRAPVERSQFQTRCLQESYFFIFSSLNNHLTLLLFVGVVLQEFEIELEGSQYLRILCYEKCYDKTMLNKDDNEIVDKIMGKGQVQVRDETRTDRVEPLFSLTCWPFCTMKWFCGGVCNEACCKYWSCMRHKQKSHPFPLFLFLLYPVYIQLSLELIF